MVCFPFDLVDFAVNGMSFSSKPLPGIERIGYWRWMNRLFFPAKARFSWLPTRTR